MFARMRADGELESKMKKEIVRLASENASLKADKLVTDLCESLRFKPGPTIRKALLRAGNAAECKALIEALVKVSSAARAPATQRPGADGPPGADMDLEKNYQAALVRITGRTPMSN